LFKNERTIDLSSQRLISLDALRGWTIAAMVLVNDPGSWGHIYPPLRHADWHGITPTDLIFPFFVFFVGVSISLSYTKRLKAEVAKGDLYRKIVFRTLMLFALGTFLHVWPEFEFPGMRIPGVLQRISIVFFVCAIFFINTNWKTQIKIGAVVLILYWLLLALAPVPIDDVIQSVLSTGIIERKGNVLVPVEGLSQISEGFIAANYLPGVNMCAWVDRAIIPGRFYEINWDPEGILPTIPAIVTCLTGMIVGRLILHDSDNFRKLTWLFFVGFSMYLVGEIWGWFFPLNKNMWTSSFVMWTSGMATMGLAACILIVDILGWKRGTKLGRVYGANAITSYVLAGMLTLVFYRDIFGGESLSGLFMENMTSMGVAPKLASLMYAIMYVLIIYITAVSFVGLRFAVRKAQLW